jgi:hypothetical protein
MVVVPNAVLLLRILVAKKHHDCRELVVGTSEDHRDHLLVYLFAMLLPLYADNLSTWRSLAAALAALGFIVFLFWHLNLHYMNLLFAALAYHVFTLYPLTDGNALTGNATYVLITRRVSIAADDRVTAYRISDTVYLEAKR